MISKVQKCKSVNIKSKIIGVTKPIQLSVNEIDF